MTRSGKSSRVISLLAAAYGKKLWKVTLLCSLLPCVSFLLQLRDSGSVAYEISMYENKVYRYGVVLLLLVLLGYCFWMLRREQLQKDGFAALPISWQQRQLAAVLAVLMALACYVVLQALFYILFYMIYVQRFSYLNTDNGLALTLRNAMYTRWYLAADLYDFLALSARMLLYAVFVVWLAFSTQVKLRHKIGSGLLLVCVLLVVLLSAIPLLEIYSWIAEIFPQAFFTAWMYERDFPALQNVQAMVCFLLAVFASLSFFFLLWREQQRRLRG